MKTPYDTVFGRIAGFRTREQEFEGNKSVQMQLRVISINPDTGEEECDIISSTLFHGVGLYGTQTWSRMFLLCLVNPENHIGPNDVVEIGCYGPKDGGKISFCALRRPGNQQSLPGFVVSDATKSDPVKMKAVIEKAYAKCVEVFGEWKTEAHDYHGEYNKNDTWDDPLGDGDPGALPPMQPIDEDDSLPF